MASAPTLFAPDLPAGFRYAPDFITAGEETALVADLAGITFSNFAMRGVVARRRVAFFGASYDAGTAPIAPLPGFLLPIRARLASWTGLDPELFAMALVNEYPPGAPIGWHRDAPQYDLVAGLSLLAACRMKLRPYVAPAAARDVGRRAASHEIQLDPRSAYLLSGDARSRYEHHIPAVTALRYSVTFRTLRRRPVAGSD